MSDYDHDFPHCNVDQEFEWPTLSNMTYDLARNHCLSIIQESKVATLCVNVTDISSVLDLCIMEVKVSCKTVIKAISIFGKW